MSRYGQRKILFLLTFILLLFLCPSYTSASYYHEEFKKYKLLNDLTVILEEDHSIPLVNLAVWIRTGSAYEGKFTGSGISHFIEHMVYKGSAEKGACELAQSLQALGGELDGTTSKEFTYYGITVPSKNIIPTMELVHYILTRPFFGEDELAKEREVILHEMAGIDDDPHKYLMQNFWRLAFQGHPYGEPIIGNELIFNSITRDNLIEYYSSRYVPQNMILVVVGDFDSKSLAPFIEKLWCGDTSIKPICPYFVPEGPVAQGPVREIIPRVISKPYIAMGFFGPSINSPDMYPMDVLAEVTGGGKESRLVKKLRDKLGLVTGIDAWSYTPSFTGLFGVDADLVGQDWRLVEKNILKELYRLKFSPIGKKELGRAKKRIMRRYLSSLETIGGKASDLGSNEIYTRNPLFAKTYINGMRNVKQEDIQRVAKKYFRPDLFSICVLEPRQEEERQKEESQEKDSLVDAIKLDNGIRVLIKEDHDLPLVTVRLLSLGGLLEEDIPGLSYFASQLWLLVNPQLVKDIEDCGGAISCYSGNNSIGCYIEVLKEDIYLALDVLKKLIQQLPIEEEKMELTRKLQLAQIKEEEDKLYGYSFKKTKGIFFGKAHPYRNTILGTPRSVTEITEEDILEFKNNYLVPENIVLVICGDVDTEELIPIVKEKFGGISAGEFLAKKDFPSAPLGINRHIEFRDTKDAIAILAYPGVSMGSSDRYALEISEQLFSGQAGRLFAGIREKEGLSYSVGALNFMGREPGMFMFYIVTDTENVDNAIQILKEEISRIKKEDIDPEELQRIKTELQVQLEEQMEGRGGYSLEVGLGELYGLGWDYYRKHIEGIKGVSLEDIKRVANKYLRDDWYTLTIIGPVEEGQELENEPRPSLKRI